MSVVVVDAAAIVDIICSYPPGRAAAAMLQARQVITPAHMDAEAFQALARIRRAGILTDIQPHVEAVARLNVTRFPLAPLLAPARQLLATVAANDALYVALAHSVRGALLTTDQKLQRAAQDIVPIA